VLVRSLQLRDFRGYRELDLELGDGLTVLLGDNGQGKTNLLEAIGFVGGLGSFRGAPDEAMVRAGTDVAIIRCGLEAPDGREVLVECEIARSGRNRVKVNRQKLARTRDLVGVLPVTVFSPDDLELVKGTPSLRRRWLDEAMVARHRRHDALRADLERILRQRNALLKQARGRLSGDISTTLEVWDAKLAAVGDELRAQRVAMLELLTPLLSRAYDAVAAAPADVQATYSSSWGQQSLLEALAAARPDDLRRGLTTVGPHRDEVVLTLAGTPARTHASQGEQRSLALALRLATDAAVRESGVGRPVVLLDDVFSELDPTRASALLQVLPETQLMLTSAAGLPAAARPDRVLHVVNGTVREAP
jgi:DNA replication and repair protein RecF